MLLVVMLLLSYLDVLIYEQLDVSMGRQVHRHLIDCIPKCALNSVFISSLLETIVPILLRGKWTPAIHGNMATLMERNLSVENQNEHENWLATCLGEWSWRFHNFGREVRRPTANTAQGIVWAAGRLINYWNRCNQCIGLDPSSNSSANMCMVFLGASELETHWFIVFVLIFKCLC